MREGGGFLVVVLQCLLKLTRTHHGGKRGVGIWGVRGGVGGRGGVLSRGYAVSAPADRDASQLYYSYLIISVGGRGVWGASGGCKGDLEGGFSVVVMQCLLLLTGMLHSYNNA